MNRNSIAMKHLCCLFIYTATWSSGPGSMHAAAASDAPIMIMGMASDALQRALSIRAGSSTPPQPSSSAANNKKYTAAAASAMETMNSLTAKNRSRQPIIPTNLLSESALMDKETNAIYWQGGAQIFSTSLAKPYLTQRGVLHVKATILTMALWLWVWGKLSRYLASKYFGDATKSAAQGHKLLFALPFLSTENALPPLLQKIAAVLTPIIQFFLLLSHSLLYLRLPQYSPKVLFATILLYLLESYSCSTRRYLSHALNAPSEVETYLEKIRNATPSVTWKVRCFHYEEREFWKSWKGVGGLLKKGTDGNKDEDAGNGSGFFGGKNKGDAPVTSGSSEDFVDSPPSWLAKKVVTHQAVGTYKFGSWEDHTVASTWKRSQSFSSTSQEAPFSKLTLSKLLLLRDKEAREDYFAQQAAFVMMEGRKDVHAEFATRIDLDGFRPKLLAVRPIRTGKFNISAALFRQHIYILATLLGLSLPYRIWFGKHCDEIRVTVVKETSSADSSINKDGEVSEGKSSWFRSKWGRGSKSVTVDSKRAQELFRKSMQAYSLYEEEPAALGGDTMAVVQNDSTSVQETTPIQPEQKVEPVENPSVETTIQEESQVLSAEVDKTSSEVSEPTSTSVELTADVPPGNC